MPIRVFFLDDMQIRRERFAKARSDCEITFAETAQEAIDILSKDLTFDEIWLDHDLGHRLFINSEEDNCGYQVARFLQGKDIPGRIIVHSWNSVGAKAIMALLPQAEYQPFSF